MDAKIDVRARRELVRVVAERYQRAAKRDKRRILDQFVAITGYHRKHSIRLLNSTAELVAPRRTRRFRVYDEAVKEALIVLWEASDRICGKRLKALLSTLVPALERHGHLCLDEAVRGKLLTASAATIDRLLTDTREGVRASPRPKRRAKTAVQRKIPIRTFGDWNDPRPGYVEADLVSHCGQDPAGSFAHTLVLTDVCSGWTECMALVVREGTLIVEALEHLRTSMPFPLLGFDTDNGSEFLNDTLLAYCEKHKIEFTRSRPYRKNDQAWVEQKNGAVVRRLVGHRRLEGIAAADSLSRLYAASRLFVNFFQPSFKLIDKKRFGARVVKRYEAPTTPCAKLLAEQSIEEEMKERLRGVSVSLDPLRLLDEIRSVQRHLVALATGSAVGIPPGRDADLEKFLAGLSTAWQGGEIRPTHREKSRPTRYWRTRPDPFAKVWPRVRAWLDVEPDRTAKELLERLQRDYPGEFSGGHLRTLQRRVQAWRADAARRLVFADLDRSQGDGQRSGAIST
jgi:hypothetical protein